MTLSAILTLAIAVFGLAIKPGAGMMMIMSRALSQGFGAVMTFMVGINAVSIFYLLLVFFGFKYAQFDLVFISILIKSLAAVYLIWLGVKGLQERERGLSIDEVGIRNFFDNLTSSIVLTLSNPLVIIFYAGIIPTILDVNAIRWEDLFIASMVIIVVETLVAIGYTSPLILYRNKVSPAFLEGMRVFGSVVIIMVGLYIGYTALPAKDLLAVF